MELDAFAFKTMECCSKPYNIYCIHKKSVLQYQHQWVLEHTKTDDFEMPKVNENNWAKTIEAIELHLVQGVSLAYVVRQHTKVAHISPRSGANMNLDKE